MNCVKPLVAAIALAASAPSMAASLSGSVKDTNSSLPGVTVSVVGLPLSTTTDYQGRFQLPNLPAGQQQLKVSYKGYEDKVITVDVSEDSHQQIKTVVLSNTAEGASLEEVMVLGHIVRGEMKAVNTQRQSDRIISVIAADGIGKLPDRNAAEAVQRIPGVSIERDQGEGRFVAVRGLPSQWSSSSLNGNRLPTAEEETTSRATAFDFFPSEMIEFVEVSKAVTPDMEGDAIGGNVNFITRTAPDEEIFTVSLGSAHNEKADSHSGYSANVLYGNTSEDGRFGYIVNATAWERDWATDNFEPRRGADGLGIRRLELRDYTGTRSTYGLNAAAEYNFDQGDQLFFRAQYGTLEDDETHYKHRNRFDKDRVEVQHIHNVLITEMRAFEFGGEHFFGDDRLDWKLSTFDNEFRYGDAPGGGDNAYFVMRFDQKNVGYVGLEDRVGKNYAYNTIDGGSDPANAISNHLPQGFAMDPTQTRLAWVELYKVDIKEKDKIVAELDWTQHMSDTLELKFGAKYRDKERNARFADEFYAWDTQFGPTPTLADFNLVDQPGRSEFLDELNVNYQNQFSQVASIADVEAFWCNNRDKFVLVPEESALVSNGGALGRNFDVSEDHLSAYGMASWQANEDLKIVGGLRITRTSTEVDGQVFVTNEETGESQLQDNPGKKSYTSLLPSVHLTYDLSEDTKLRASIGRTFARPDFGDISPGGTYAEHDNEFSSGNPDLDPTYSVNYDLLLEHYFSEMGVVSAGLFYKDITDPIFKSTSQGSYAGRNDVELIRPENGDDAKLYGMEFSINRRLDFLPGIFQDMGIIANYTWMDSEMTIPGRSDEVSIPRQADSLYNLTAYYDNGSFQARLALNHKDSYIEEHGSSAMFDSFYGDYTSLDFSASYQINDQFMVYLEANNLNNEPLNYYIGSPERPKQLEYYGIRGQFGFKYTY